MTLRDLFNRACEKFSKEHGVDGDLLDYDSIEVAVRAGVLMAWRDEYPNEDIVLLQEEE